MCILRNVSKDEVEAVRLNNSYLMLDRSYYFYINGYIYTTFALGVMSGVIQIMCNLVVVTCLALPTKVSNVTRISFSFEIYLL